MPKPSPKKIKLARKKLLAPALVTLAVLALFLPYFFAIPQTVKLTVGQRIVRLYTAKTPAAQERGLSGRADLATDRGMLFVFENPEKVCLWMKDMGFSLDMLWLDGDKKVLQIQQNAIPESYPEKFCATSDAKYVIELRAGQVKALGIRMGQPLDF